MEGACKGLTWWNLDAMGAHLRFVRLLTVGMLLQGHTVLQWLIDSCHTCITHSKVLVVLDCCCCSLEHSMTCIFLIDTHS